MLFQPTTNLSLDQIHAALEGWNGEADRFRAAAVAARAGGAPSSMLVTDAEDMHDGLMGLLEALDRMVQELPLGDPRFRDLLQAQAAALGLDESLGNSLDLLASAAAALVREPRRIAHDAPIAVAAE
jgi:hypothetical protein